MSPNRRNHSDNERLPTLDLPMPEWYGRNNCPEAIIEVCNHIAAPIAEADAHRYRRPGIITTADTSRQRQPHKMLSVPDPSLAKG
jgi:hypothetical protein